MNSRSFPSRTFQDEAQTLAVGHDLVASERLLPPFWKRGWWDDRLMALTMTDPATKVQLFRFIDSLPVLSSPRQVRDHLEQYLAEAGDRVPASIRLPVELAPAGATGDRLIAGIAHHGASRMAGRFIAGSTPEEAIENVLRLRRRRRTFTADLLGEAVLTDAEADDYLATCQSLLESLSGALTREPEVPQIDRDAAGPIPRMNLSVKLSSLAPRFDPLFAEASTRDVLARLRPLLRQARQLGAFLNVDMEQYAVKDLTFQVARDLFNEPEFRDWPHVGIVVQAYLKDALEDLETLRDWARQRGAPLTVRLVKGAYWDYEVTHARQVGWPVPVFEEKARTDLQYEKCTRFLLANHDYLKPAFGSHNVRSIAHALATAESLGLRKESLEVQMLHGMGGSLEQTLVDRGYRVRIYAPYGKILPGMAYLVRRLLENTSNDSFLRASRLAHQPLDELLRNPEEVLAMRIANSPPDRNQAAAPAMALPAFQNEPPTDFSRAVQRDAMREALGDVRRKLGRFYPRHVLTPEGGPHAMPATAPAKWDDSTHLVSRDPGDHETVVGFTPRCTVGEAEVVIAEAREAFGGWSLTPALERAQVMRKAARLMRMRRLELAAWIVFETAKPWREADADVAETIDFCEFYAREMVRRAEPEARDVPGETNRVEYLPRGVAAVIPPWNFPLAIPAGMTVAALVAGNTVILKPAEQSPVVAWHLVEILKEAGVPPGALQYLPGTGEEVGQTLVNHPDIDLIAFTGSREVGLLINRQAAQNPPDQDHVKRVIAEMGGKNAIIVDADADLDEAVEGVLASAFSYAGQKCSACSRVLVLESVHDAFLDRLVAAAQTLPVGPASDPATFVNALIDAEARDRFNRYRELARQEGRVVLEVDPGELASAGNYVGPVIVADVDPHARVAQEEIFGPLLCVLRVRDLDHALQVAHGVPYALTGGIYTRSPANLDRVRAQFRVGNLYINRPITGALVNRQPFGGFKLSGIGTKAGGSDYLNEFLLTRVVTENTMRRGFAPEAEASSA